MPSELDPTLRTVSSAVAISYSGASCLLSIAWIWGAYYVKRGLLENVVLGTKIRITATAIVMAFIIYVMSQMENPSLIPILGETRGMKLQSVNILSAPNLLALALRNSAGKDKDPDKRNDDIDEKTKKSIQKLALKNPADKDKDKDPEKKKDDPDEKSIRKGTALTWAVLQFLLVLGVEALIIYRLDQFVKSLPE
ncbi:uncharacterized protein [Dermacentor andersoni]|uniref:uncharacterized protein isoform X1 n=2 Tax=Dermacentor andersoni TaxID=34620 RepID=UPI003B3B0078